MFSIFFFCCYFLLILFLFLAGGEAMHGVFIHQRVNYGVRVFNFFGHNSSKQLEVELYSGIDSMCKWMLEITGLV